MRSSLMQRLLSQIVDRLTKRLRHRAARVNIDNPGAMATPPLLRLESPEPDRPLSLTTGQDAPTTRGLRQKRRRRRSTQGGTEA